MKTNAVIVSSQLSELENVIERGLSTFVEVGAALLEIREARLYRESYSSFEEYCRERWKISKPYATQLIAAARVVENVVAIATVRPTTESQVRPLTMLPPEEQRGTWSRAEEIAEAEGVPVRARHVERAVGERKARSRTPNIEKRPPADTLIESWRDESARMEGIVEDTLADGHPASVLAQLWSEAAEPMVRALQKFNPTTRSRR